MTVIVTKMPGGITQLFNPETGKITYKCKSEQAFLKLDAFGGIVQFNKKGSKAIIDGSKTSLEECNLITKSHSEFDKALNNVLESEKRFKEEQVAKLNQEISEISEKL